MVCLRVWRLILSLNCAVWLWLQIADEKARAAEHKKKQVPESCLICTRQSAAYCFCCVLVAGQAQKRTREEKFYASLQGMPDFVW